MSTHSGADVVLLARQWLGTPYHHQASEAGVGCDCLGLVRGVWRALHGREPQLPVAYTRDWAEAAGRETMLEAAMQHLVPIGRRQTAPGDVLLFRLRSGMAAKHCAIVTGATTMIHAMEGGPVSEVALSPWWQRRIAGVFLFPGIER